MTLIRRRFLSIAGATVALPVIPHICDAQLSHRAPKLTTLLRADLRGQDQMVQETMVNSLELAPGVSAPRGTCILARRKLSLFLMGES